MSEQELPNYSEGILCDGAVILRDGVMMPIHEVISALNQQAAEIAALSEAAQDFVDKVERGEARSVRSYRKFKKALNKCGQKDLMIELIQKQAYDLNNRQLEIIDQQAAEISALREALKDAATSLRTIADLAGNDEFMDTFLNVRGYANSRSIVAFKALGEASE